MLCYAIGFRFVKKKRLLSQQNVNKTSEHKGGDQKKKAVFFL